MWKRSDLKARAKSSFKRNYWKSVLVGILLTLLMGGGSTVASNAGSNTGMDEAYNNTYEVTMEDGQDKDIIPAPDLEEAQENDTVDSSVGLDNPIVIVVAVIVCILVFFVIFALCAVLAAFTFNPFEVGCTRFFLRNLQEPAQVGNIGYAFDNNYKNIAKTMFFRDMYTFFWTLLFVIPGIVKAYEYRMIPYLLADNPQMTKEEAFAESKRMMKGQKWRAFVLDLSFIGWYILSGLTLGILGVFYVIPYVRQTGAALYEALRYGTPQGAGNYNQINQEYV